MVKIEGLLDKIHTFRDHEIKSTSGDDMPILLFLEEEHIVSSLTYVKLQISGYQWFPILTYPYFGWEIHIWTTTNMKKLEA